MDLCTCGLPSIGFKSVGFKFDDCGGHRVMMANLNLSFFNCFVVLEACLAFHHVESFVNLQAKGTRFKPGISWHLIEFIMS